MTGKNIQRTKRFFSALAWFAWVPIFTPAQQPTLVSPISPVSQSEFEVASVKPSTPDTKVNGEDFLIPFGNLEPKSSLFSANASVAMYVLFAYDIRDPEQMRLLSEGLPQWAVTDKFDIEARTEGIPTRAQMRLMMQSLLRDRFNLAVHYDSRQGSINALVLEKPGALGPNLKVHPESSPCTEHSVSKGPQPSQPGECGIGIWRANGALHVRLTGTSMPDAARFLNSIGGMIGERDARPIVDKTGLKGNYDLDFEFTPENTGPGAMDSQGDSGGGPTFTAALKNQLGLKLVKDSGTVRVLVIDHVEKPSAD